MNKIDYILFAALICVICSYILWLRSYLKFFKVSSINQFVVNKCYYPPHFGQSDRNSKLGTQIRIYATLFWILLTIITIIIFAID